MATWTDPKVFFTLIKATMQILYLRHLLFTGPWPGDVVPLAGESSALLCRCLVTLGLALSVTILGGCGRSSELRDATPERLFQLESNSMAPGLMGPHYPADCSQCGQVWSVAAETYDSGRAVACPVCGATDTGLGDLVRGQRVSLVTKFDPPDCDRLDGQPAETGETDSESALQRLDRIVFQSGQSLEGQSEWVCKRIWGLPGESVALRNGQLWIDGQMFRKTFGQLTQVMIPVSRFPEDSRSHWSPLQPERSCEEWIEIRAGESLRWDYESPVLSSQSGLPASSLPTSSLPEPVQAPTKPLLKAPEGVLDDYWLNHSTPRNLLPVRDLLLSIEFSQQTDAKPSAEPSAEPSAIVEVACRYWGHLVKVQCSFFEESAVASRRGQGRSDKASVIEAWNPQRLFLGGWDGRLWVQWDDRPPILLKQLEASDFPSGHEEITQFSICAVRGVCRVQSLRMYRDLYLRQDERHAEHSVDPAVELSCEEVYVLGDNLPLSIDSRNGLGAIDISTIHGRLPRPGDTLPPPH
jgi:hypothetical protein